MCIQMYSWGYNSNGELGIGSTTTQQSPKPITTLDNEVITKVINYGTDLMQCRNCAHVRVQSHVSASAITRECE